MLYNSSCHWLSLYDLKDLILINKISLCVFHCQIPWRLLPELYRRGHLSISPSGHLVKFCYTLPWSVSRVCLSVCQSDSGSVLACLRCSDPHHITTESVCLSDSLSVCLSVCPSV